MPITTAVTAFHICMTPNAATLFTHGYLPDTEWTCDVCGTVWVMRKEGLAAPYWFSTAEAVQLPATEPEGE